MKRTYEKIVIFIVIIIFVGLIGCYYILPSLKSHLILFYYLITLNLLIITIGGITFLLFNINERKKNLKFIEDISDLNIKILEKINDANTYRNLFQDILMILINRKIIFSGAGYIFLNIEKKLKVIYAHYPNEQFKKDDNISLEKFTGKYAIENKKLYIISSNTEAFDLKFTSSLLDINKFNIYYFPILYKNNVLGILECITINPINNNILKMLNDILLHIGVSIERIRLHNQTTKLYRELNKKNALLEAQNKELEAQSEELVAQTEELRTQKFELEEYSKKLQKLQRFQSEFLANMSHELRTPLNSIVGLSDLLIQENQKRIEKDILEKLKIINLSGKQLLNIINDILDLSKIEAGKIEVEFEKFNINEVIDYVTTIIKPQCENKNIELKTDINLKEMFIVSDKYKLNQILLNLLSNAVKYTHKGSIELKVEEDDKYFIFHVKDTGTGIPENLLKDIFDPYVSLGKRLKIEGTGLGLPLTKKLVVLLGGYIKVKSKVGEGSTFSVYIPKGKSETKLKKEEKEIVQEVPKEKEKYKILVVDDDVLSIYEITKIVKETLKEVEILTATDGLQAKKIIESQEKLDLVLLDLDMPKFSGWNLLDYMKEKDLKINVIIVTALNINEEIKNTYWKIVKGVFLKGKDDRVYLKNLILKIFQPEVTEEKISKLEKDFYRILIVDDNLTNRYLVKELLKKYNVETDEAQNGVEAIELLKAKKYDLVLLDIQMPVMDGYETFDKIRNELKFKDLIVIALTAKALKEEVEKLKSIGFNDIILKPIVLDNFYNTINKYIKLEKNV